MDSRSRTRLLLGVDQDESYKDATDVIVPSVHSEPKPVHWTCGENFPLFRGSRDEAFEVILDAREDHGDERIPGQLLDSWDTSKRKRSREYLNGEMDKYGRS